MWSYIIVGLVVAAIATYGWKRSMRKAEAVIKDVGSMANQSKDPPAPPAA